MANVRESWTIRRGRIDLPGLVSEKIKSRNIKRRVPSVCVKILIIAVLAVSGLTFGSLQICASALMTSCEPEFMDALEARGYIEAQRQIEQNGNLILKQDS